MAGRDGSTSTDSRLGRIEGTLAALGEKLREDRAESRADSDKIATRLDGLTQTVTSLSSAIAGMALEKCGDRLDKIEAALPIIAARLDDLEQRTANVPWIETELRFWQRLLGGGFRAAWKIALVIIGSGATGGILVKIIWPG